MRLMCRLLGISSGYNTVDAAVRSCNPKNESVAFGSTAIRWIGGTNLTCNRVLMRISADRGTGENTGAIRNGAPAKQTEREN